MSRHFQIYCTKVDGNKVTSSIEKLRDDIGDITADGGLEQYLLNLSKSFAVMLQLNRQI